MEQHQCINAREFALQCRSYYDVNRGILAFMLRLVSFLHGMEYADNDRYKHVMLLDSTLNIHLVDRIIGSIFRISML